MNRVYFNQADKRWANYPYPSSIYPNATVKSGGCGPTSGAMIISSFKQTIYPNEMADLFRKNGYRAATGTDSNAFTWLSRKYGLQLYKSIYLSDALSCLERKGMIVALCKAGGLFSTGGHFIVLSELRGDNIVVFDPYLYNGKFNNGNRRCVTVKGNEAIVSKSNFKKYNDYTLFCFENPIKEEPSKYQNGQWVEINVPIAYTGSSVGSDMGGQDLFVDDLKGLPTSQYYVHESIVKDLNRIVARAQICWTEGKRYLVQVFNRQFWINEDTIVKKLD